MDESLGNHSSHSWMIFCSIMRKKINSCPFPRTKEKNFHHWSRTIDICHLEESREREVELFTHSYCFMCAKQMHLFVCIHLFSMLNRDFLDWWFGLLSFCFRTTENRLLMYFSWRKSLDRSTNLIILLSHQN